MTAVETRPTIHSAEINQAQEGPLPQFTAREIINQFISAASKIKNPQDLRIVTEQGTVKYEREETDKDKKRPAFRRLTVFSGPVTAGATDSEDGGKITWSIRDGKSISGAPTTYENNLEAVTRLNNLLSHFLPEESTI